MVSLLFVLFLAILVFSIVQFLKKLNEYNCDEGPAGFYCVMIIIFGCLTAVFFSWTFSLINTVATASTIERKITMYQEENASIEESIDTIVKGYMDFETNTYSQLKAKDSISLVSLVPELKADTLVQKQIEVYLSNNAKIKELKEEQINLSKAKWKLYFGR